MVGRLSAANHLPNLPKGKAEERITIMSAQWIWYPGEFEVYLGLNMYSCRSERRSIITPNWDVDSLYNNVIFNTNFTLEEDTWVKIHTTGTRAIYLDEGWYVPYDEKMGLMIPKGSHSIHINVFAREVVPALYIDHPVLKTGKGWIAGVNKIQEKPVAYWNFTDVNLPPHTFAFSKERWEPVAAESINGGILYDFGKEMMSRIYAEQVKGSGTVTLCFGESREEALDANNCTIIFEKHIEQPGEQVSLVDVAQGCRYVWIFGDKNVRLTGIYAEYEYLPIENKASFRSDDALINKIYDIAVHTLHLCTREFCIDGIKRDRWAWSGDATQSYLLQYYSFFDLDSCKRTMRFLRGKDPKVLHLNTIQDYTLYWFVSLKDYYLHTGDKAFMEEIYPSARSLMDTLCLPLADDRGFLMPRDFDWVFVDWSKAPNIAVGDVAFIQILFTRALQVMAEIAEMVGDAAAQSRYFSHYEKLKAKVFEVFWDDQRGCFTNGPAADPNAFVTKYASMFAMMFGYLDAGQIESVRTAVFENADVPEIVTPYMKFYELLAMGEMGMYEQVHTYIKSYWGGMVEKNCTSFWEEYDPSMEGIDHYRQGTRKFGKSLCHAWGAGPVLLYGKYYLGIVPTSAGYKTFRVEPHLNGLNCIEGTVPVPNGVIAVKMTQKECVVRNDSMGSGVLHIDGKAIEVGPMMERNVQRG